MPNRAERRQEDEVDKVAMKPATLLEKAQGYRQQAAQAQQQMANLDATMQRLIGAAIAYEEMAAGMKNGVAPQEPAKAEELVAETG